MKYHVHIKIADQGWILEKCAAEIASRSTNITYGKNSDANADIQYYINYSARKRRISPIEIAFFTHSEKEENARKRYFEEALNVEHCICMSKRYADELTKAGVHSISIIAPGVDLEKFQPQVRIGVVGRTYHTGRKGEALIEKVLNIPGIEWRFTGSGWPTSSRYIPEENLNNFYNDLDYVLIPSLYEGGPMSVLEGLACGIPIISSDVGWVYEYPHIPFENNNESSLRHVLEGIVNKRLELRATVMHRTWSAWAEAHLKLFDRLMLKSTSSKISQYNVSSNIVLLTHGAEKNTQGGPSVRVPKMAGELARYGIKAILPQDNVDNFPEASIAHIFNIWPVESCYKNLQYAQKHHKSTVLSTIFLNLSTHRIYSKIIPEIFSKYPNTIASALKSISRQLKNEENMPIREPYKGYYSKVCACVESSDHVIYLSEYERTCLEYLGAQANSWSKIYNPVDVTTFSDADPELFRKKYNLEEFILCVGRIEARKNQLILAYAAKKLNKHIVFIGHISEPVYADLLRATAGPKTLYIPRLEHSDPLLKSAFAAATVFCLPSWSEGAPLAALEAAACGTPLILSDRSSESEYFKEIAEYVNPADIESICDIIEYKMQKGNSIKKSIKQKQFIKDNFSWYSHIEQTIKVYEKIQNINKKPQEIPISHNSYIYFDLTTSFHTQGNPTGIARVEQHAYHSLLENLSNKIIPIAWNSCTKNFLLLKHQDTFGVLSKDDLTRMETSGEAEIISKKYDHKGRIVVFGGAWIRNKNYLSALDSLKMTLNAPLSVLIHDLIQMKRNYFYPNGVSDEFSDNLLTLSQCADDFFVYSETSKDDLRSFLQEQSLFFKRISKFRLGDMTSIKKHFRPTKEASLSDIQIKFSDKKFIIYVSSIDIRKNHILLINVWRRLLEENPRKTPSILFIGRPQWCAEEVLSPLSREKELSKYVHHLDNVNDKTLHWLYQNCLFTVYPSLYEGWGLPVAESLSYGKVCLTSDRTSTREIAPDLTDLLDPYDFRAWVDRVSLYLDHPELLENRENTIRKKFKEHTWKNAASEILSIIDGLPYPEISPSSILPNTTVDFSNRTLFNLSGRICIFGWDKPEKFGRWTLGPKARISFTYARKKKPFWIQITMHGLLSPKQISREVYITINDILKKKILINNKLNKYSFYIDKNTANKAVDNIYNIDIEIPKVFSPNEKGINSDKRLLGVYVYNIYFGDNESNTDYTKDIIANNIIKNSIPKKYNNNFCINKKHFESLQIAYDQLLPDRLPPINILFKILRLFNVDYILISIYKTIFGRTHDSIRRIIDILKSQN